jgi:hypothetical protein
VKITCFRDVTPCSLLFMRNVLAPATSVDFAAFACTNFEDCLREPVMKSDVLAFHKDLSRTRCKFWLSLTAVKGNFTRRSLHVFMRLCSVVR